MTTAFDRLVEVLRALHDESVAYVLFGGQAVNLNGIPRFAEDIPPLRRAEPRERRAAPPHA